MQTDVIYVGNCVDVMKTHIDDNAIDLTVTSPPYDNLRAYNGYVFDFEAIAQELYRVTKTGGIVVWVVADETKNFCESLTSFKQAIYFVEMCGFYLLDTMIYQKSSYAPAYPTLKRYANVFEYMFVFSKDKPKTFNPIQIDKSPTSIKTATMNQFRNKDKLIHKMVDRSKTTKNASNVFIYSPGNDKDRDKFDHSATFPDQLAKDHIFSWSNENDIVFDPMCGAGTTLKMAKGLNRRFIGIDISQEYVNLSHKRIDGIETGALL